MAQDKGKGRVSRGLDRFEKIFDSATKGTDRLGKR
jgi:hypothetical protein